jgi:shikimate kinase
MTIDPAPTRLGLSRGPGLSLVGYRGTGKSTVGKILADRLDRRFLDADAEIESRAGRSIPSLFAESREPEFRDWEERTIRELVAQHPGAVIATGGGAILREANRGLLRTHGLVIWLRAEPGELARRLSQDESAGAERPSLTPAGTIHEIAEVLAARSPIYEAAADVAVDTLNRTPEEVAELILGRWNARCLSLD